MIYFIGNICSPEEIEKKRLLALQRREQAQLKTQNNTSRSSPIHQQQIKYKHNSNVVKQYKSNRYNPIEPRNFYKSPSVTGKCYMISCDRFAFETSSFVPAIIEIFKTVPSRLYGNCELINLKIISSLDLIIEIFIYIYLIF